MIYKSVATCAFGLESVLSFELKKLGVQNVAVSDGRVTFDASERDIVRANLWLRTAERVLIVIAEYKADTFDMLFDGVTAVDWAHYIAKTDAFPVKGYSMNSVLTSVPACQSIVKKAVVESLKRGHGTAFLTETGPRRRIQFSIVKDFCTILLDTSGDGLHKRGYRPLLNEAPIKETLAAGIVDLARIRADSRVADPFCGSGTLVIEAAQKAKNIAPGLKRDFPCSTFSFFERGLLDEEKERAKAEIIRDAAFVGIGTDIDPAVVETAAVNAKAAGVADCCSFSVCDAAARQFNADDIVLANPPYGERLLDDMVIQKLYGDFCKNLSAQQYKGFYIITNYPQLEADMGRPASRRRKLYNGMIQCQLYMYY